MADSRVTVLGAGSWGMAMAGLLDSQGCEVTLWEYDRGECDKLVRLRTIPEKLPDYRLRASIRVTDDLGEACRSADLLVFAVPSQVLRSVASRVRDHVVTDVGIVNLAKGIESPSLMRMSQVVREELGDAALRFVTLSGPSHAEEVIRSMPTTVVVAGSPDSYVQHVQEVFSCPSFRVYECRDVIGVELGGSLKNIIAIAAGIVVGLGMGDNTLGALITRGLAEVTRLGLAMGAQAETFAGLSGVGDLVTTCVSRHSRNRYVGERIGRGETLSVILDSMSMVAEGVETTRSGYALALKYVVEMPITREVHSVLFEGKSPREATAELMERSLKAEVWR